MKKISEILDSDRIDIMKCNLDLLFHTWNEQMTKFCNDECKQNDLAECDECSLRSIIDNLDDYANGNKMNRVLAELKASNPKAFKDIAMTIKEWHLLTGLEAYSKLRREMEQALEGMLWG